MSKHTPKINRPHPAGMGGYQKIFRFPNGYGASVVEFPGSYGLELAVIEFEGADDIEKFHLTYETPITDDVLVRLDDASLEEALDQVQALPVAENVDV